MHAKGTRLQYLLLTTVTGSMLLFYLHGASALLERTLHGDRVVRPPLTFDIKLNRASALSPEAEAAGMHRFDDVVSLDGRAFTGGRVYLELLQEKRPGEVLHVVTRGSDGRTTMHAIRLQGSDSHYSRFYFFTVIVLLDLAFPLLCILLGSWVVLAKPLDSNAWLLLGVFCFFPTNLLSGLYWTDPVSLYVIHGIGDVANQCGPLWIFLFGIYFPQRSRFDVRFPWVKWVFIGLTACFLLAALVVSYGFIVNFTAIAGIAPYYPAVAKLQTIVTIVCFSALFALLANKIGLTTDQDARRRLRLLYWGGCIGSIPVGLTGLIQLIRGVDFNEAIPHWLLLIVLVLFTLFPLTLAYVVVVQRAMDVRILVRQGTKYAFARQSVFIIRALLAVWLSVALKNLLSQPGEKRVARAIEALAAFALFFAFRSILTKRLQQTIDQRFFREAYSTEQVLSELSEEARNFTEAGPLLDRVTQRIGETLHVQRIAVFLRVGESFQLHPGAGHAVTPAGTNVLTLPAASATLATLMRSKAPANVYRDDPTSWLVDATDAERAALADLSTELLVPLPGRSRLAGVIALGPKRSEEPYTKTDRQLLQTVASQTGLALENAELLEHLTVEIAQRERISRDIEIAREVQERLFPQSYPAIDGVDMAGHCRPAQAVGGDYYDFFSVPSAADGGAAARLAIAIGDISGKGIPAALLMASLRASLRSVAMMQPRSLAVLMQHVNRLVYEASTTNRYATFFYAEYEPATRLLTYVNAGHNSPYVLRAGEVVTLEVTGTVVGLLDDAEYGQATLQLQAGDVLLAFTDGISEAMTREDEEWGEARMLACAQSRIGETGCMASAQQLLTCVLAAADGFTQGAPQHDDMTLVLCVFT